MTIELRQRGRGMARFGPFMLRRAARKELDGALDGLSRAACDEARAGVLGLGRAGGRARRCPSTPSRSCATSSASPATSSTGRWRSRTCGCASRRSTPRCARRLEEIDGRRPRRPRGARAALPRQVLPRPARPARGRLRGRARRRRGARRTTTRCSPCCRRATRRAWRSCRSAAARAWSAASSRCAGRSARWSRSTSARMDALLAVDERSLTAALAARPAAARGGPRARRPRAHARPRAAELRVGDGRRLRGHALGRPGLDRARADRREPVAVRCRDAARRAGHARRARRAPPGPTLRQLVAGSRGRARRDHRRDRCACTG